MTPDELKDFFNNHDLFARHNGMQIVEVAKGYAKATMNLEEHHLNGVRVAQGGAVFTLADLAFAAACNSHGTVAVAINVSITFMQAATEGPLVAEAREVVLTPKLSNCYITVTDGQDRTVATFQGLAYRKKGQLKDFVLAQR